MGVISSGRFFPDFKFKELYNFVQAVPGNNAVKPCMNIRTESFGVGQEPD